MGNRGVFLSPLSAGGGGGDPPAPSFDPLTITNLSAWWDPSDDSTTTLKSGDLEFERVANKAVNATSYQLGDLVDQSQLGGSLQGVRPSAFDTGETINGLTCLDGTDTVNVAGMGSIQGATWPGNKWEDGEFSIHMAIQLVRISANDTILIQSCIADNAGGETQIYWNPAATAGQKLRAALTDTGTSEPPRDVLLIYDPNDTLEDLKPHIISISKTNGTGTGGVDTLTMYIDGVEVSSADWNPVNASSNNGWLSNPGSINNGAARFCLCTYPNLPDNIRAQFASHDFKIGEMLVVNGATTEQEITDITTYLKDKWVKPVVPDALALGIWWDPSDSSTTAISANRFTLITNKKLGIGGDLDLFLANGPGQTGSTQSPGVATSGIGNLTAIEFGDPTLNRSITPAESSSASKDVETDAWRVFMVVRQTAATDWAGTIIQNGIVNTGGFEIDTLGDGRMRLVMGDTNFIAPVSTNNPFADQQPHVLMFGRTIGGGTGDIDRYRLLIDNQEVDGIPDFGDFAATGTEACSNTTNPVSSARYITLGASPAAPPANAGQNFLDYMNIGEVILVKEDMETDDETSIYNYLASKWGVE
jgi:hypothetical protein